MSSLVGKTIAGRYRVDAFIDTGGMGAVYRVWDLRMHSMLAMKVLKGEFLENPHILKRFKREAKTLEKLRHPNIVRFYGFYHTPEMAFLLEDYLDGTTLRDILRRRKRQRQHLTPMETLTILKAVSAALSYAHEAHNVIHCDIKPDNVMLDRGGNIYLMDFGIARHAESEETTFLGAGTLPYMAPEQLQSDAQVTPATDVYALGVMTYELLTGRRPFEASHGNTTARREYFKQAHTRSAPPDPRKFAPELPPKVSQVLLKALHKDPSRRFKNAWTFFNALSLAFDIPPERVPKRALTLVQSIVPPDDNATTQLTPYSTPPPPPPPPTQPPPPPPEDDEHKPYMPWLWIILGLLALLSCVTIGGAAFWYSSGKARPQTTAPTISSNSGSGGGFALQPTPRATEVAWPTATPVPPPTFTPPRPTPTPKVIIIVQTPTPDNEAWEACSDAPLSRLHPGMKARVAAYPPLPNRVRSGPGKNYARIGWVQVGEEMEILDGPACANHWVWWKIRSLETGLVGWTAEGDFENYWLEPLK